MVSAPHIFGAVLVAGATLGGVATLVGCGGPPAGNGAEKAGPAAVTRESIAALRGVRTVHLVGGPTEASGSAGSAGTSAVSTRPGGYDLRMSRTASVGTIAEFGRPVSIVITAAGVFLHGDRTFTTAVTNTRTAAVIGTRWIRVPTGQAAQFAPFTLAGVTSHANFDGLAGATVARIRLDGQPTVMVSGTDGSRLYVAGTGPPYPLRSVTAGGKVTSVFSDFNQPLSVTTPAGAYDLGTGR